MSVEWVAGERAKKYTERGHWLVFVRLFNRLREDNVGIWSELNQSIALLGQDVRVENQIKHRMLNV